MGDAPFVIGIDGPSASGKGTIARKLAAHFDLAHLDTGLLYRAVAYAVLQTGNDPTDAVAAEHAAMHLDPQQVSDNVDVLRSDEISVAASKVASIPGVRAALLKFQKDFCATPPQGKKGAVLDGRDIGTVIAPDAQVKIFVIASAEARAMRRFKELQGRGLTATYGDVLDDMRARDARDAERTIAPTKPAPDAVMLDTTKMDAAEAVAEAMEIVNKKIMK